MNPIAEILLKVFLPQDNVCLVCERALWKQEHLLCSSCSHRLEKLQIPEIDQKNPTSQTGYCLNAYYYADVASKLIHLLKYDHVPIAAELLGTAMSRIAEKHKKSIDLIVPVPIHNERFRERGYNQAEKLAEQIGRTISLPVKGNGLLRTDSGRSMVGLNREERMSRQINPFRANTSIVCKQRILLVDDVYTTGTTISQCTEVLLNAGAANVLAITACRA